MIDKNLVFDSALALTSDQVSTNVIPLGPLNSGNTARNIGGPSDIDNFVELYVNTALVSGGSSTLTVIVQTDSAEGFGGAVEVTRSAAIAKAALTAGSFHRIPLPAGFVYKNYLRLSYDVGTTDFTGGTLSAYLTNSPAIYRAPASGLSVA